MSILRLKYNVEKAIFRTPVKKNSKMTSIFLGLVPTVLSLICMNTAIKLVGSTPAAIMGSLEPVTAVLIGIFIFNELFTAKLFFGILLILLSVILIVKNQNATVKKKS